MKLTASNHLTVTELSALETVINAKDRLLVLVYASWCPFCRRFLPVFEQYAQGREDFWAVQDDDEIVAEAYGVDCIPTVLFFEKGELTERLDGQLGIGLREEELAAFIERCCLA
ncbi:MAG TPA: thioredoxin family protein [Capillibacterium sp.]